MESTGGNTNIYLISPASRSLWTLLLSHLLELNFKSGLHQSTPAMTIVIWNWLFRSEKPYKKPGAKWETSHLFCQAWFFGDVTVLFISAFSFTTTQRHVTEHLVPIISLQTVIADDICDLSVFVSGPFSESPSDLDSRAPSPSPSVAVVYPPHLCDTDASMW